MIIQLIKNKEIAMSIDKLLENREYERALNRALRMKLSVRENNLKHMVDYCLNEDPRFVAIQWAYDAAEKLRRRASRREAMLQIVDELWRQYCSCCGVENGYWRKWVRLLIRSIKHLNKEKEEEYFHLFTGNARLWRWYDIKEAIEMAKRYPCHACYAAKWEIQARVGKGDYDWFSYVPFLGLYWKNKSRAKIEKWLEQNFGQGYNAQMILRQMESPSCIFICRSYDNI